MGFGSGLRFVATAAGNIAGVAAVAPTVQGELGDWMLWLLQGEEG